MAGADRDFFATLGVLYRKGLRYSTVVDVGCADGQFFLNLAALGIAPGAVPLNVDANAIYEPSLKSIKAVVGGHYRIAAASDAEGSIEMTTAVHPYWSSVRGKGDIYWNRLNALSAETVSVPAITIDGTCASLGLKGPFLLKLDVQGAEVQVLEGASATLAHTTVVICEADVDDFQAINSALIKRDFVLYDITHLNRVADQTLGWFYPVYVKRSVDFVLSKNFWDSSQNAQVVEQRVQRRQANLSWNAQELERLKARKRAAAAQSTDSARRNEPCPCGSGKKYKHCHGALRGGPGDA